MTRIPQLKRLLLFEYGKRHLAPDESDLGQYKVGVTRFPLGLWSIK